VPWERVLDRNVLAESRNVALAWLEEHRRESSAVLVAEDAWFDARALDDLDAEVISSELRDLDHVVDRFARRIRYVVVPTYERPWGLRVDPRSDELRLQALSDRLQALRERADVISVFRGKGQPVRLSKDSGRRLLPMISPELTIFEMAPDRD
jgi:hypothetical protein